MFGTQTRDDLTWFMCIMHLSFNVNTMFEPLPTNWSMLSAVNCKLYLAFQIQAAITPCQFLNKTNDAILDGKAVKLKIKGCFSSKLSNKSATEEGTPLDIHDQNNLQIHFSLLQVAPLPPDLFTANYNANDIITVPYPCAPNHMGFGTLQHFHINWPHPFQVQ